MENEIEVRVTEPLKDYQEQRDHDDPSSDPEESGDQSGDEADAEICEDGDKRLAIPWRMTIGRAKSPKAFRRGCRRKGQIAFPRGKCQAGGMSDHSLWEAGRAGGVPR